MTQLEPLLITSMLIRGRKREVEEFLEEFRKKVLEAKAGIESELRSSKPTGAEVKTTQFVKKKSVLVRQITAKSEKEANDFDLSKEEGIRNTEEMFVKWKRFERWLTL